MAKKDSTTTEQPKRRMLTPEELVAKKEAELAEAKAKLAARQEAQSAKLFERAYKLRDKIVAQTSELNEINAKLVSMGSSVVTLPASEDVDESAVES